VAAGGITRNNSVGKSIAWGPLAPGSHRGWYSYLSEGEIVGLQAGVMASSTVIREARAPLTRV
jgi:hypothetical protein